MDDGKEKEVMKGGPDDAGNFPVPDSDPDPNPDDGEAPTDDGQPDGSVSVTLDGQTFEVDPDVAKAIEAREHQSQKKISEQGAELGKLRNQQTPDPTPPQEPAADLGELLFDDPDKAVEIIKEDLRKELTDKYTADQALKGFWDHFYVENPHLTKYKPLVQTTLQGNMDQLADLKIEDASKELAELVDKQMVSIAQSITGDKTLKKKSGRSTVEGSSGTKSSSRKTSTQDSKEPKPKSITQLLADRKKARSENEGLSLRAHQDQQPRSTTA